MVDIHGPFQAHENALYSVGALMLNWGRLEARITYSIVTMHPNVAGPHVNPDNAARTLEALMNKWFSVYGECTAAKIREAEALRDAIIATGKDRNTIGHGFSGIVMAPPTFHIVCWEQYHRHRMTGVFPPQRFFSEQQMIELNERIAKHEREIDRFTAVAIARPRKPKNRAAP
jgi:hypothetical protein